MKRPRVLLADDYRMVLEGLKSLLSDEFDLVGAVEDGYALLAVAAQLHPDVIVADITMPRLNGLDALVRLKTDSPDVAFLLGAVAAFISVLIARMNRVSKQFTCAGSCSAPVRRAKNLRSWLCGFPQSPMVPVHAGVIISRYDVK